ncbi:hypothetical protein MVEN_02398600 [Mycena venus]|uniref:Heme haloperoxidase family profile domain-containing protein n=1 Tax=Mycena venus TaxID=2733690 RepID=A0A8H6X1Z5_9AGAR|nr:hypothetical protein MVEN_02398600 [Mycena venus]
MSLPAAHPEVNEKAGKTCPVTGKSHEYQPPAAGDARSVCPAINTMANHGYIRRDGKNISPFDIVRGLKECYGLSSPLAMFLTAGGWLLIKRIGRISLFDLGLHNATPPSRSSRSSSRSSPPTSSKAASANAGRQLTEAEVVVTGHDICTPRSRGERWRSSSGVWNQTVDGKEGIPLPWMRDWLADERLPEGWQPDHVHTLRAVVKCASAMRAEMKKIREGEAAAAATSQ